MRIKFINPENIPALLLRAIEKDYHNVDGDISVTELINPPQIKALKKLDFELEIDASREIWRLIGSAVHGLLEDAGYNKQLDSLILKKAAGVLVSRYNKTNDKQTLAAAKWLKRIAEDSFKEDRWELERTLSNYFPEFDIKVYGTFDLHDRLLNRIEDYKLTKSWAFTHQEEKTEWAEQQNVYRYLYYLETGKVIDHLRIWGLFRDWNSAHTNKRNYPPRPIMPVDLPVWDMKKTELFVRERLELHVAAASGEIPKCTGKERWAEAAVWKIYRPGQKSSIFKTDREDIAKEKLSEFEMKYPGAYIEEVPGINKRCREFCPVAQVCPQWKSIQQKIINP